MVGLAAILALSAAITAGLLGRPAPVRAADPVQSFVLPADADLATPPDQLPLLTTGGWAHGLFLHCCLHRFS